MRRTTDAGIALIKRFEGRALESYRCPAGVLTIGYGHTSVADGQPCNWCDVRQFVCDDTTEASDDGE